MQVCDLTQYDWVPVRVLWRNAPVSVPLYSCRAGIWTARLVEMRGTAEVTVTVPLLRESFDEQNPEGM